MDAARVVTVATVGIIVTTVLLSGTVDLTQQRPSLAAGGEGDADLSVSSVPADSIVIRASGTSPNTYHLRSDPAVAEVRSVSGTPFLVYELEIPALGFSSVRKYVLTSESVGRLQLELVSGTFESDEITQDSYRGVLTIRLDGTSERVVYQRNLTIEVES